MFTRAGLGVVAFIWVRLGSLGPDKWSSAVSRGFTYALLKVARFIRVRVDLLGHTWRSSGLFGFALVHPCAPRGRRGDPVRVGSLGRVMGSSSSFGFK